ncbi:hypothetical protein GCM10007053_28000 [Halioglobus pacificus]|uniref:Peptidase S8/S53 domain-containing protein n=1 Tax=Parahalioglobus pacificus TaxID=930806 RepID=A0A918XM36_9GAMM|nr:hypothetical protein GCM10007053_28000 [Halioglobus pacificus]
MRAVALCLLFATCAAVADENPPRPTDAQGLLHVMLQGESAETMATLAEQAGGTLTHHLPIIDAVGARLTPAQFDTIRNDPRIARYIDDLALEIPPEATTDDCPLGGALEVVRQGDTATWSLFNKSDRELSLTRVAISWPTASQTTADIKLASKPFAMNQTLPVEKSLEDGELVLAPGENTLSIVSNDLKALSQSDLEFSVSAGTDCTTELVPGYPNNHEDFYYATVAGADALHKQGITGNGVTVAVLDSGLWEHPALTLNTAGNSRILARYDAITGQEQSEEVFDESGHGTHMTSVLAHSEPTLQGGAHTGGFKGIAPDVSLIAVKAFDIEGQGDFLDIVRGVQYVVDNREKYGIRVLNLSFAARPRWPYWLDPVNQAVMRAWADGITVVAAAGNEGPEPMTVGSPGNLPYIITVGAVTDSWTIDTRDDDYVPDFSSQGPTPTGHIKPDIVAPGGHITGVTRPGSTIAQTNPEYFLPTGEFVMTGTSQASALVSGLAALLLQLQPELSPDDVKCKFTSSAELAISSEGLLAYSPFKQGLGYVSLQRAITLGDTGCGNSELDLAADLAGRAQYEGPAIVDGDDQVSLPGLDQMLARDTAIDEPDTRIRWGVKEFVERPSSGRGSALQGDGPFDWAEVYAQEREKIRALAGQ